MECLVWARITNLFKIICVGYDSNKEIKEFINKIDELLIKSKRIKLSRLIKTKKSMNYSFVLCRNTNRNFQNI